jgi:hypothetical protein
MVNPYGGILLLFAALGLGLVASLVCAALRGAGASSRKPRTPARVLGEGVAFFACNFLGYVASSLVLGLLSGAFAAADAKAESGAAKVLQTCAGPSPTP